MVAPDAIGHNYLIGPCQQQFLIRGYQRGPTDNEQAFVHLPCGQHHEKIRGIIGHSGYKVLRPLYSGLAQNIVFIGIALYKKNSSPANFSMISLSFSMTTKGFL